MNGNEFQKSIIEMAVVNTDHLSFVKNGTTQSGSFTVSVFKKEEGSEQYGILVFSREPQPKVLFFKNTKYDELGNAYYGEVELYKQHISQTSGVDYSEQGVGFKSKMQISVDVQGFTSKQEVDENGNPVFNEDGTPKMVNAPFSGSGTIN